MKQLYVLPVEATPPYDINLVLRKACFIREVIEKYYINHNPKCNNDVSDWWSSLLPWKCVPHPRTACEVHACARLVRAAPWPAPGFQTGPTWRLVWKLSFMLRK